VRGRDEHFIVNLLGRNADLLDAAEAAALDRGEATSPDALERGYLVDPGAETAAEAHAYASFVTARADDEVQLFFAPTYACNFGCTYCYQAEYAPPPAADDLAVIAAFFAYVDRAFTGRKKYLTLFGGEPLLDTPRQRSALGALIDGAAARGLDVAVVTNGFHLTGYLDLLARAHLREIQITLDGTRNLHDARRPLKGGGGTFDQVAAGVEATLTRGIPVNLRVVVDRDNLSGLPELARYARDRGWTTNRLFKTQLGRNYELHVCQASSARLYSRLEINEALYELIASHPEVLELHRPAFSVARHLAERGELPEPLFDSCPACKTEWAFDTTGRIYPCTATVGKDGEQVGTFYPEVHLDSERAGAWQRRDVTTIPECRDCAVKLACGGGCGSVAKNRTGRVDSPDCRPVRESLELGLAVYTGDGPGAPQVTKSCCG
jgi:uncharacterized protein